VDELDIKRLNLANHEPLKLRKQTDDKPPRPGPGEKFLKGPIPWRWIITAARLPGKSLHIGIGLWFLAGVTRSRTVKLSNMLLKLLGVTRFSKARGLLELERAGLIRIDRRQGKNPLVTILNPGQGDREG
jgi:hypothetical protein